jgi:hypothetical protein
MRTTPEKKRFARSARVPRRRPARIRSNATICMGN